MLVLVGMVGLPFVTCRSVFPDEAASMRAAEQALPAGVRVESTINYGCGLAPRGCTMTAQLSEDPDRFEELAAEMRERLLDQGWRELRFGTVLEGAGGSYRRGRDYLSFSFKTARTLEQCQGQVPPPSENSLDRSADWIAATCASGMWLGVPSRGVTLFGFDVWTW